MAAFDIICTNHLEVKRPIRSAHHPVNATVIELPHNANGTLCISQYDNKSSETWLWTVTAPWAKVIGSEGLISVALGNQVGEEISIDGYSE